MVVGRSFTNSQQESIATHALLRLAAGASLRAQARGRAWEGQLLIGCGVLHQIAKQRMHSVRRHMRAAKPAHQTHCHAWPARAVGTHSTVLHAPARGPGRHSGPSRRKKPGPGPGPLRLVGEEGARVFKGGQVAQHGANGAKPACTQGASLQRGPPRGPCCASHPSHSRARTLETAPQPPVATAWLTAAAYACGWDMAQVLSLGFITAKGQYAPQPARLMMAQASGHIKSGLLASWTGRGAPPTHLALVTAGSETLGDGLAGGGGLTDCAWMGDVWMSGLGNRLWT